MLLGLIPTVYADYSACGAGRGGINLGDCLQLSDSTKVSSVYDTPAFIVNLLISNLYIVAGIILFIIIIAAGFKFITGGKKGAEDAKNMIQTALIGFIIMFSAYWIMQIVALLTGITIPGVTN
jgi:hypothetical protein